MIIGSDPHSYANKVFDFVNCYSRFYKITTISKSKSQKVFKDYSSSEFDEISLTELMNKYGSDKGAYHGYTDIYEKILNKKKTKIESVLEIGIGTNNPELLSSMGEKGRPGASLRAWRDYFPNAEVLGLDIDRNIQFSEKSIVTDYVNQLKPSTFNQITGKLLKPVDLVIIDGLHTPRADFNSLIKLLPFTVYNGDFFIEDVGNLAINFFWPPILSRLAKNYNVQKYILNKGNLIHITCK